MKDFQNVVDIVRDLMSAAGTEKIYKEGMRKDNDGFMDIEWCSSAVRSPPARALSFWARGACTTPMSRPLASGTQVLKDWDELRKTFLVANGRKAIAPTQFNHQSTRGHCIMTIECEMPKKDDPDTKMRGRVYVCDLAGTEPAGDVVYAVYEEVTMADGTVEKVRGHRARAIRAPFAAHLCAPRKTRALAPRRLRGNRNSSGRTRIRPRPRSCRTRARRSTSRCRRWRSSS